MPVPTPAETGVGRRLRALREERQWSRDLLARKSGTAPLTILRAEVHGTDPTLETLRSWAAALDVSVADLLVDDGPEAA